ncbi:DNA methyltransferase [Ancrocorticia populi]|uniref:Site-specific DNA-methyltransferase n=1 Tax=Ancrocorticia populi TaxID=2175228 RepID=A0A2V1KBH5_9ACTO|nr:DNA methyltransferase [Ancrocorticia populi]PWF27091.1 site-specific DNA-methyltransferase [Ancrocorticia populi]
MSRLSDLLRVVEELDPELRHDLEEEIKPLQQRLPFGLNFERHAPEAVELAGHPIRRGSKVRVLPSRRTNQEKDQRVWLVRDIHDQTADIAIPNSEQDHTLQVALSDLVLVAEFRDRIYPGLRPDGVIENGDKKPFHTVINGENFHVLEQLTFTHEHAVDVIFIDPPYNSRDRDWKYNNDYVDSDDLYRHSKWLAFMERRLKLARRLLKTEDSALIVTIDEKEQLRLGLLLEQTFPEANIQMVTTMTNKKGSTRNGAFCRRDEYLFVLTFGDACVRASGDDMISPNNRGKPKTIWNSLLRRGADGSSRQESPNLFFPLWIDHAAGKVVQIGDPIPLGTDRKAVPPPDPSLRPAWPIRSNGSEGRWQVSAVKLRDMLNNGTVRLGRFNSKTSSYAVNYLKRQQLDDLRAGVLVRTGTDEQGAGQFEYPLGAQVSSEPGTIWVRDSHDASTYGTNLLSKFLPRRRFPFPKSLYAVEDTLRFFVKDKPNALILDFFAGSGTTAHAVMRLNKQDGGRRQCILVTNNEVSAAEQTQLQQSGFRPGDREWDQWGICDYVTKPRIRAAITGRTPEGSKVEGSYKFVDEFPMEDGFEENAAFFTLTYESPWMIGNDKAFASIAPMLWLRAGAIGERIDSLTEGFAVTESYGVLRDLDMSADFISKLREQENLQVAFIVTDDEGRYQQVSDEIPEIETVRLYEEYLRNCEITGDFE